MSESFDAYPDEEATPEPPVEPSGMAAPQTEPQPQEGETAAPRLRWPELPRWALPAGGAALAIGLLVVVLLSSGVLTPREPRCLPTNRITPAAQGEHLLVVAEFADRAGGDLPRTLRRNLAARPGVRVAQTCQTVSDSGQARALGGQLRASGVVWAENSPDGLAVHVDWLAQPDTQHDAQSLAVPPQQPDAYTLTLGGDPASELAFVGSFVSGQVAGLNFDRARAAAEFEAALDSQPDSSSQSERARLDANAANVHFALGTLYLLAGPDEAQSALESFDWVVRLDPEHAPGHYNRGVALYVLGQPEAVEAFSQAIALDPSDAAAFNGRGAANSQLGDYEAALRDLEQAIALDGDMAPAYNSRGVARVALGDGEAAIGDFDRALEIDPNYLPAYENRGQAHFAQGQFEAAIADYNAALARDPQAHAAYVSRGLAHFELGDYHAAIADFTQALGRQPEDVGSYFQRARASYQTGDYLGAISDLTTVISAQPENAAAYLLRANAYFGRHNYAAADADYSATLELTPESAEAYFMRGVVRADYLESYAAAIADFGSAIDAGYQEADVYLNLADALFYGQGRALAALDAYQQALERNPDLVAAQRGYALALFDAGRHEESEAAWRDALALDAFAAEHHAGLALALDALGEREAALTSYAQALELDGRLARPSALRDEFGWPESAQLAAGDLLAALAERQAEESSAPGEVQSEEGEGEGQ